MNKEQILEAICDIEIIDQYSIDEARKITLSPEKLAAFLAEHLEEKVVDESV